MLQSRIVIVVLTLVALFSTLAFAQKSRYVDYEDSFSSEDLDDEVLQDLLTQNLQELNLNFPKLDMSNSEHVAALEALASDEEFIQFRNTKYQIAYGVTAQQFDDAFLEARDNLLNLAAQANLEFDLATTSFNEALELIASSSVSLKSADLQQLFSDSYLFEVHSNLEEPIIGDATLYAPALAVRFISWLVRNINSHKCGWCKSVVSAIRKKLCGWAGSAICRLASKAFGALSVPVDLWVCGNPLNVSGIFAGWCNTGVRWIQRKLKLTDRVICGFSIPRFSVLGQSVAIGKICR